MALARSIYSSFRFAYPVELDLGRSPGGRLLQPRAVVLPRGSDANCGRDCTASGVGSRQTGGSLSRSEPPRWTLPLQVEAPVPKQAQRHERLLSSAMCVRDTRKPQTANPYECTGPGLMAYRVGMRSNTPLTAETRLLLATSDLQCEPFRRGLQARRSYVPERFLCS